MVRRRLRSKRGVNLIYEERGEPARAYRGVGNKVDPAGYVVDDPKKRRDESSGGRAATRVFFK
jgi:hypothetical protein